MDDLARGRLGIVHLTGELGHVDGLLHFGGAHVQHPGFGLVGGRDVEHRRLLQEVHVQGLLVAGREGVAVHLVEQVRRGTVDGRELLALHAQLGHGGQQRPGVGMTGVEEDLVRHADLDDLAGIHDRHAIRHVGHNAQVVSDVDDGHVLLALQLADQLQDLSLDGHVQRGSGLVADQNLRVASHGDGDDDALTHAAGELMGILVVAALGVRDAHQFQQLDGLVTGSLAVDVLVQLDSFADLHADLLQGVQAGHGVLGNHGDLLAADGTPLGLGGELGQVLAVVHDVAAGHLAVLVQHTHEGLGEHGLTGAGLTHDGEGFAVVQVQGAAADGLQLLAAQGELHLHVTGGQDGLGRQYLLGAVCKFHFNGGLHILDGFRHTQSSFYT